jgi:hypothetical protein
LINNQSASGIIVQLGILGIAGVAGAALIVGGLWKSVEPARNKLESTAAQAATKAAAVV